MKTATAPKVIAFPGKTLTADQRADRAQMVSALESLLEQARNGRIDGLMFMTHAPDGGLACGRAGWYYSDEKEGVCAALMLIAKVSREAN